jgi:hypothetical protein
LSGLCPDPEPEVMGAVQCLLIILFGFKF